jgi:hypothetical protein
MYHGAMGMQDVMLRGKSLGDLSTTLWILFGFISLFLTLNQLTLKK